MPRMDDRAWVRLVNLSEVLLERAQEAGRAVEPLTDEALRSMSEAEVVEHYAARAPPATAAAAAPRLQPPSAEAIRKWFPGLERSGTRCDNPRLRVVCFPSAGNAEDMFTSEGTGARRAPNALLDWCRAHQAEVWAVQPPGRAARAKEPPAPTAQALAQQVFDEALHHVLLPHEAADDDRATEDAGLSRSTPWVLVSHSVGTWVAYELLRLCQAKGVPLPKAWFLSAMPAPDIPPKERPWRRQAELDERQFMEECRAWDINELVFSAGMWPVYQPLLRADFTLFDSYVHQAGGGGGGGGGAEPFPDLPLHCWWGEGDRRVTKGMVQEWRRFTTGPVQLRSNPGNHLWPLHPEHKRRWLLEIVDVLDSQLAGA